MRKAIFQTRPEFMFSWLTAHYINDDRVQKWLCRSEHLSDRHRIIYGIIPKADNWEKDGRQIPIYIFVEFWPLSDGYISAMATYQVDLPDLDQLAKDCLNTLWNILLDKFEHAITN